MSSSPGCRRLAPVFAALARAADVRQILGRPGQVWGAESAADALVVLRGA